MLPFILVDRLACGGYVVELWTREADLCFDLGLRATALAAATYATDLSHLIDIASNNAKSLRFFVDSRLKPLVHTASFGHL